MEKMCVSNSFVTEYHLVMSPEEFELLRGVLNVYADELDHSIERILADPRLVVASGGLDSFLDYWAEKREIAMSLQADFNV